MGLLTAVVVVVPVASVLWALAGGGKKAGRAPWKLPIPRPGTDIPWTDIDMAMCLAFESGARAGRTLTLEVLRRLWSEVPWPAGRFDHASLLDTSREIAARVSVFLGRVAAGEQVCDFVGPGGEEPAKGTIVVEPPPPPGAKPADYIRDTPAPGFWGRIHEGDNPTTYARKSLMLPSGSEYAVPALRCIINTGWNLYLYSRRKASSAYTVKVGERYYDVGPAFLPRNQDAAAAIVNTTAPVRTIDVQGGNVAGGSHWGMPWVPELAIVSGELLCPGDGPWSPARNPPPDVLAALGLTLDGMRAAWESHR